MKARTEINGFDINGRGWIKSYELYKWKVLYLGLDKIRALATIEVHPARRVHDGISGRSQPIGGLSQRSVTECCLPLLHRF